MSIEEPRVWLRFVNKEKRAGNQVHRPPQPNFAPLSSFPVEEGLFEPYPRYLLGIPNDDVNLSPSFQYITNYPQPQRNDEAAHGLYTKGLLT